MTDLAKIEAYAKGILDELAVPTPAPAPAPVPPAPPSGTVIPATAVVVTSGSVGAVILSGNSDVVFPSGDHGVVDLVNIAPANLCRVWCAPGAHFERFFFSGKTANVHLMYPSVWPVVVLPKTDGEYLVHADKTTDNIMVFRADTRGHVSAENYGQWTLAEWIARQIFGISLGGTNSKIKECRGLGLRIPFMIGGAGSEIVDCLALGVSEDSWRVVGNGSGYTVRRVYSGDFVTCTAGGRHPDVGQAWSVVPGGKPGSGMLDNFTVEDIVGVDLIERAGVIGGLPASCAFLTSPQGIGFHDGNYSNVLLSGIKVWNDTWWGMHVELKAGANALVKNCEFYDARQRQNASFIGVKGAGVVDGGGNIAGMQTLGTATALVRHIDYAKAPKPMAPPAWSQWA